MSLVDIVHLSFREIYVINTAVHTHTYLGIVYAEWFVRYYASYRTQLR